jgi:hypothetical protein
VVRVDETKLTIADQSFTYRSPIVEVYLDDASPDGNESALIAPPWGAVPWHLLALMDAAVERGIAAFSQSEAERRGVPWLDLARDAAQRDKLRALIKEFAASGYRPAALEGLVTPEAARARWQALDQFAEENGHLLVVNGPYRLKSASSGALVFDVIRDFTYPVGLGTFNNFPYPPQATITAANQFGNRVFVSVDVEMQIKQQRDRKSVRTVLTRETLRDTFPIFPTALYMIVGEDGRVAAAGTARREADGRFVAEVPAGLRGATMFTAVFLDGNTVRPDISRISLRNN